MSAQRSCETVAACALGAPPARAALRRLPASCLGAIPHAPPSTKHGQWRPVTPRIDRRPCAVALHLARRAAPKVLAAAVVPLSAVAGATSAAKQVPMQTCMRDWMWLCPRGAPWATKALTVEPVRFARTGRGAPLPLHTFGLRPFPEQIRSELCAQVPPHSKHGGSGILGPTAA